MKDKAARSLVIGKFPVFGEVKGQIRQSWKKQITYRTTGKNDSFLNLFSIRASIKDSASITKVSSLIQKTDAFYYTSS